MPVTMSVENRGVPSSSRIDIRTSSRSRSSSVAAGPCAAAVHDPLHQVHEPEPGLVAPAEAVDGGVGVDVGDGVGALLEVVVELGEAAVELVAELAPDETGRGRVDGELGEPVQEVDRTASSPTCRTMRLDLVGDGGGVAPHELVAQRLVVEHLAPALGRRVEDHALSEDRRHERVGLGLVEHLLGGAEEHLVGLGPGEQHHVAVGQPELAHVAALGRAPGRMRAMGSTRSSSRCPCSPSPPDTWGGSRSPTSTVMVCLLCWCPSGRRREPRAGLRSRGDACPAASTPPPARRRRRPGAAGSGCGGAAPNRTHSPSTSAVVSGPQSVPISVRVWPGWTMVARTPVPSSSSCRARTKPSSPHFDAM